MKNTKEIAALLGCTQQVEADPALSDEVSSTQETIADLRQFAAQRFSALMTSGADVVGATIEMALPDNFPKAISLPLHLIGDRVYYQGIATSHEFGVVIGMAYVPATDKQNWQWRYQIALDEHSPSQAWVGIETAWEDDVVPADAPDKTTAPTQALAERETP